MSGQLQKLAQHHAPGATGAMPSLADNSGLLLVDAADPEGGLTSAAGWLHIDVSSGVDVGTLVENLMALHVAVAGCRGRLQQERSGSPNPSWLLLHRVLTAWFHCMGATQAHLEGWLGHLFPWAASSLPSDLTFAAAMPATTDDLTLIPFQSFVEVLLCRVACVSTLYRTSRSATDPLLWDNAG